MLVRPVAVLAACMLTGVLVGPVASAEPDAEAVSAEAAPVDDGRVESSPPATTHTPDGWTLTVSATGETQRVMAPLTTAISSREYQVGGVFNGSLTGPDEEGEPPHGTLEVGYQIGCGIDMTTSNGVTLNGSVGITPSLGLAGVDVVSPLPEGLIPVVSTPVVGGMSVALKPGIINVVPVSKKQFTGNDPWIMVDGFRIKIDGCVGESFIRSYAFLTRSTDQSDAVTGWYGVTKKV